jgi:hypothetical protein
VRRATCRRVAAADALGARGCDLFDDGSANSSCGVSCTDADGDKQDVRRGGHAVRRFTGRAPVQSGARPGATG